MHVQSSPVQFSPTNTSERSYSMCLSFFLSFAIRWVILFLEEKKTHTYAHSLELTTIKAGIQYICRFSQF